MLAEGSSLGVNRLGHTRCLLAQSFAGPVPQLDCILRDRHIRVIRIDVTGCALNKETLHVSTQRLFNHAIGDGRKIGGVLGIVGSKNDRMTCIVDEDGERIALTPYRCEGR